MVRSIGNFKIGKDVIIEPGVIIEVDDGYIGDRSIIRSGAIIRGRKVILGRECYLDRGATIGGGSCEHGSMRSGDWLHMGMNSQINIARNVIIGEEVGIGIETKIFTHGAYLPVDCGFVAQWGDVHIGNRVWLPNAWVNPKVTIGDNVVVAARSLINKDIPSNSFAAGVPAKVKKEIETRSKWWFIDVHEQIKKYVSSNILFEHRGEDGWVVEHTPNKTIFYIDKRMIKGCSDTTTEKIKEQLRRNGIRFKYIAVDGEYEPWPES
jgi:acetyltransferase-like isoleucine patch superfamily enzyme